MFEKKIEQMYRVDRQTVTIRSGERAALLHHAHFLTAVDDVVGFISPSALIKVSVRRELIV